MFKCVDCKVDTHKIHEYYMVKPEIWSESGMKYHDGMLCIGCLENRLHRKLIRDDFDLTLPINTISWNKTSERLKDRLSH